MGEEKKRKKAQRLNQFSNSIINPRTPGLVTLSNSARVPSEDQTETSAHPRLQIAWKRPNGSKRNRAEDSEGWDGGGVANREVGEGARAWGGRAAEAGAVTARARSPPQAPFESPCRRGGPDSQKKLQTNLRKARMKLASAGSDLEKEPVPHPPAGPGRWGPRGYRRAGAATHGPPAGTRAPAPASSGGSRDGRDRRETSGRKNGG